MITIDFFTIVERLLLASFLGALIGLERDSKGRSAGLRTQIIVALGSALFMVVSLSIVPLYSKTYFSHVIRIDPARIAAQIISGIGFLGAGAIIKLGINVRGLTTASCIWLSAGIGMACGMGRYELAALAASIGALVLIFLNYVERYYKKDSWRELIVEVEDTKGVIEKVIDIIKKEHITVHYSQIKKDYKINTVKIILSIKLRETGQVDKYSHRIIQRLEEKVTGIKTLCWFQKKD